MKTINFKIISNKNENIYQYGYVEVPEDVEEMPEWFYYDQNGFAIPRVFTHHDEIGLTQIGATSEQEAELEAFWKALDDEVDFIEDAILTADEDENRTYVRENITLIINEGAEFSIEYEDYTSNEWDSDYYMAFTPKFNGERVMLDGEVYFQDPYTYEHFKVNTDILYENGAYIIEIPKGYWEDDDFPCEEIIAEYKTAFKRAYAQTISKELGVYAQYGENAEQLFEECNIKDIALISDENLHEFLINEGIINNP